MTDKYPNRPGYAKGSPTSKAAAASISEARLSNMQARIVAYLDTRGEMGATADEAEMALRMRQSSVTARLRELVLKGVVIDSGLTRLTRWQCSARIYRLHPAYRLMATA